jgi:hypothetical protein
MSKSFNNFCESLVNGSNPRYTYSQPSIAEQVAWQVKKEEEARQTQINETMNRMQKAQYDALHSSLSTPSNLCSYTPSTPSFLTQSLTSISTPSPSFAPSLTSIPSFSSPSYSSSYSTIHKYSWEK